MSLTNVALNGNNRRPAPIDLSEAKEDNKHTDAPFSEEHPMETESYSQDGCEQ